MSRFHLSKGLGRLKIRTLIEVLLAVTLVAVAWYLFIYVPKHVKSGEPVLALTSYFLTYSPIQRMEGTEYVVPDSLGVWDTPAEIRNQIATLQSGDEVQALGHFRDWTHVDMQNGQNGWVSDDGLINQQTYQAEVGLRDKMADMPAQACGHPVDVDNVHIQPSRQATVVAVVDPQQTLGIFGRRMVRRTYAGIPTDNMPASPGPLEAWYLVQVGSHAGWILGHRVQLDFPKGLAAYAQDTNLVAWVVLDTVDDGGHKIPQYVVADRAGMETCDFTDIRVLTWWKRKQTYAVAYKAGGLQGYFPILVTHQGTVPFFRLRLVNDNGAKCQTVYGLYDTITRVIGVADGWQRDAVPEPRAVQLRVRQVALPSE